MELSQCIAGMVNEVKITDQTRSPSATGYGAKLPTRYMLKLSDKRYRRVYVVTYGNIGSTYVLVAGVRHYLSTLTEQLIDTVSNGGTITDAVAIIKGYPAWMSEGEGL